MATPSGRSRLLDCAPAQVGPCRKCAEPCHRYGNGGSPLCAVCQAEFDAWVETEKARQRGGGSGA